LIFTVNGVAHARIGYHLLEKVWASSKYEFEEAHG
jgi:hypothetical protein